MDRLGNLIADGLVFGWELFAWGALFLLMLLAASLVWAMLVTLWNKVHKYFDRRHQRKQQFNRFFENQE